MSRSQQGDVTTQAQNENTSYNTNAQNAFTDAQSDVGDYGSAVGQFAAANPYTQGGSVQTAQNQETADTAAGQAQAAGQAVQGAAVRTGQNAGGAIAATEDMQQTNERNLVGQEATNTQNLAAANTGYQSAVLGDTATQAGMQDTLANQQASAAQGALGTQETAAQTPSFMDELGSGLIGAAGSVGGASITKYCWIAAELFGGWDDWRTIRVRTWLTEDFGQSWYGAIALAAYARFGERVAIEIQTRRQLRSVFQRMFDAVLRKAVMNGWR